MGEREVVSGASQLQPERGRDGADLSARHPRTNHASLGITGPWPLGHQIRILGASDCGEAWISRWLRYH